jgi:O-antigen ligase
MITIDRERGIRLTEQGLMVCILATVVFIPISESAKNISIALALTMWALSMAELRRFEVRVPMLGWFFLGLLGATTLSAMRWDVLNVCGPLNVARGIADVFIYTSFFLLIANTLSSEAQVWPVLLISIVATGIGDLAGIYTYFLVPTTAVRLSIPGLSFTAAYLAMALVVMAALLIHVRFDVRWRILIGSVMVLSVVALVFTHTRSMWLITGLNLGLLGAMTRVWKWLFALFAFFVLVAFAAMQSDALIKQRVASLKTPWQDASFVERISVWKGALRMARDHPLLGVGPKCFKANREKYGVPESFGQAHNLWFHVAAELGGLGVLTLIVFIAAYASLLIKIRRNVSTDLAKALWMGCLGSFLVILIGGIIDPVVFRQQAALFFSTLTGLLMVSTGLVSSKKLAASPDPCELSGRSSRGTT